MTLAKLSDEAHFLVTYSERKHLKPKSINHDHIKTHGPEISQPNMAKGTRKNDIWHSTFRRTVNPLKP